MLQDAVKLPHSTNAKAKKLEESNNQGLALA
jgi:hypothetical protein